jgi:hypothetical protein
MRAMPVPCAALLVSPRHFAFNAETAASNALQRLPASDPTALDVVALARAEHARLVAALDAAGIATVVADDGDEPLPDAVFPNNWISFHEDGTLVLYPMLAPLRRRERRAAVIAAACAATGFSVRRRLDLTRHEREQEFLEGTGSLVLDRDRRVAYACRSPRTSEALARTWAAALGYELCCFDATDANGIPYYHTNVMMWIGARCAVVCLDSVREAERAMLRVRLSAGGRALIELTRAEVAQFCGNMLELTARAGSATRSVLLMSANAAAALRAETAAAIGACVDAVVAVPVPTIERLGGGSVRCMVAEVPLSRGDAGGQPA